MKKVLLSLMAMLLVAVSVNAKPVDAVKARQVAETWMTAKGMKNVSALQDVTAQTPFTEFYVFAADGGGFILVSADDCVKPVLGYSVTGTFVVKDLPAHVRDFFAGYEQEIRYWKQQEARRNGLSSANGPWPEVSGQWQMLANGEMPPALLTTAVSPLLTTTWGQQPLYNDLCPYDTLGASRTVTGCVATATSQIMKYHNHPSTGYGSHSYHASNDSSDYGTLSANFGNTTYQWSTMPNALSSTSSAAQVNAVATLMYHVGVADEMGYNIGSRGGSGANNYNLYGTLQRSSQSSLQAYFKYRPDMVVFGRSDYSDSEYCAMLRAEIDQQRPILYSGRDYAGGHSFVLHGYDNNGLFYVNWGWRGSDDGYYAIGALNPGEGGDGGNATYTFNDANVVVTGIRPNTNWSSTATTTVAATISGGVGGTLYGAGTYNFGDTIPLYVSADEGYRFAGWSDGDRENPRQMIANGGSYSFTANVAPLQGDTLGYCAPNCRNLTRYGVNYDDNRWGIRLPASSLPVGHDLTSAMLYVYEPGTYTLEVYTGTTAPTTLVASSATVYIDSDNAKQWIPFTLTTPLAVDGTQNLWVTFVCPDADYPATVTYWSGNYDGFCFGDSMYAYSNYNSFMINALFSNNTVTAGDTVSYCGNSEFSTNIGTGSSSTKEWGIMLPASVMTGSYLKSVMLYVLDGFTGTYTLNVYRGGDTVPSTLAHTQVVNFANEGWQEVMLDASFALDSQNLWVTFSTVGTYPMAACDYTGSANSDWFTLGNGWTHCTTYGLDYSWMIKVVTSATAPALPAPAVSIEGQYQIAKGQPYTYTATGTEGATITWSLPGATPSTATGNSVTATWNTTGEHAVIATISNAYGTGTDTLWNYVVDYTVGDTVSYALNRPHFSQVGGAPFSWGIMLPSAFLTNRNYLNAVQVGIELPGSYTLRIYQGGDTVPQTLAGTYSITVTAADTAQEYTTFDLPTPLALSTSQNLWIVVSHTMGSGLYPARTCYSIIDQNSDWITLDDTAWYHLYELGIDNSSWMIKAITSTTYTPPAPVEDTCSISTFPYTMNFENGAPCWSIRDNNGSGATWGLAQSYGVGGSNCAYVMYEDQADDWLISPSVVVSGSYTVAWKTRVMQSNNPETYQVWALGVDTSIMIYSETFSDTTYVDRQATFTVPAGDSVRIMWRYISADMYILFLDNIVISQGVTQYTLTAGSSDATMGSVTGGGTYNAGATATLTATPNTGYRFVQWQDGNTDNPRTVIVTSDTTFTATFASFASCIVNSYPYNLSFDSLDAAKFSCWSIVDNDGDGYSWMTNSFSGYIASASYINNVGALTPDNWFVSPQFQLTTGNSYMLSWRVAGTDNTYFAEHYGVYVSTTGTAVSDFTLLQQYTLTSRAETSVSVDLSAYAGQNVRVAFRHWNCTDQYWLLLDSITVTESTTPLQTYTITAVSADTSMGTVTGGGTYYAGTTATLVATPNSGYVFVQWQDGNTDNPRSVVVNGNATYTATFEFVEVDDCVVEIPYVNNFNSVDSLDCWSVYDPNEDATSDGFNRWYLFNGVGVGGTSAFGIANTTGSGYQGDYLISPNVTGAGDYVVTFKVRTYSPATLYYEVYAYGVDTVGVYDSIADTNFTLRTYNFSLGEGDTTSIVFVYLTTGGSYLILDDFSIMAQSAPLPPTQYTVTVLSNNDAWGSVTGGGTYDSAATATLEAVPASGYRFAHWNDGVVTNPRSVTVTSNITYVATFELIPATQYTVTVLSADTTMGTVSGSGTYGEGDNAVITATAKEGYHFTQWNDGNTQSMRSVTVTADITYIANFEANAANQYTLTVVSNNPVWGTVTGGGAYTAGSTALLTATPNEGYHFVEWNDGDTNATRTVTVNGNASYIATFAVTIQQYTLTVLSANEAMGTVTGGGTYNEGSIVTITARSNAGYRFVQWSDGDTNASRTLTVTADATYVATFEVDVTIDDVAELNLMLYPNPATDHVTLTGLAVGLRVTLIDAAGRQQGSWTATGEQMTLDVSSLASGQYFLRISGMGVYKVKKLVVE